MGAQEKILAEEQMKELNQAKEMLHGPDFNDIRACLLEDEDEDEVQHMTTDDWNKIFKRPRKETKPGNTCDICHKGWTVARPAIKCQHKDCKNWMHAPTNKGRKASKACAFGSDTLWCRTCQLAYDEQAQRGNARL